MNLPFRISNNKFIINGTNEFTEYNILSQSIAKKYHKIVNKKKITDRKITETSYLLDSSFENIYNSDGFKDEIITWLFRLPIKDRIKACTIENKWLATMILNMANEYFKNNDVMFKIKDEYLNEEESYMQNVLGGNQQPNTFFPSSHYPFPDNLESYFHIKANFNHYNSSNKYKVNDYTSFSDVKINSSLFLNEVVFFTIKDKNDSFSLSPDILLSRELFEHNFKWISKNRFFNTPISVNYDNNFKMFNWNFPDWFKQKDFNSLPEFIAAYIEQLLCVRFWYYREKQENLFKQINDFISITEDKKFNELYDCRNRLIDFLKQNYPKKNLFKEGVKADKIAESVYIDPKIQKIVNNNVNTNLMKFTSKYPMIRSNYPDVVKNLYEAYEKGEEYLINRILFISLKMMGNYEEFVFYRIVEELQNLYSEKNAKDLINEIDFEEKEKGNKKKIKKKKDNINKEKDKDRDKDKDKHNYKKSESQNCKKQKNSSLFDNYEFSNGKDSFNQNIRNNSYSLDNENQECTSNKFLNSINSNNFNDSILIVENDDVDKVYLKDYKNKFDVNSNSINKHEFFTFKKDNIFVKVNKISNNESVKEKSKNLRNFEIKFDVSNQNTNLINGNIINTNDNKNKPINNLKNENNVGKSLIENYSFHSDSYNNKNNIDNIVNDLMSTVLESFNTDNNLTENLNTIKTNKNENKNFYEIKVQKEDDSDRKCSNIDLLDVPINKIESIISKNCEMKKFISRLKVLKHKSSDTNIKRSKSNKNLKCKNSEFLSISSLLLNSESNNFSILKTQNIQIKNSSVKTVDPIQEHIVQSTETIEINSKTNNETMQSSIEKNIIIEENKIQNNIEISYDGNNIDQISTNNNQNDNNIKSKRKVKGAIYLYPTENNKNKKKTKKQNENNEEISNSAIVSKITNYTNQGNNSESIISNMENNLTANTITNENTISNNNIMTNTLDSNSIQNTKEKNNDSNINNKEFEEKSKKEFKNNRFNNKQYSNQSSNKKNNSIYTYNEIGNVVNENTYFKNNTNNDVSSNNIGANTQYSNSTSQTNNSNYNNQKNKFSHNNSNINSNNNLNSTINSNSKINSNNKNQNNKKLNNDSIKIESLNHEIINNKGKNKKMVEIGCQTELKKLEIVKGENFQQNKKKKNVDSKICKEINNSIIVNNKISKTNSFTCRNSKEKILDSPKIVGVKADNDSKHKLNKKGENNSSENLSFKKSYIEETTVANSSMSSLDYKSIKDFKEKKLYEDNSSYNNIKNEDSHIIEENESNSQYSSGDNKYRYNKNVKNFKGGYNNYNKNHNNYFNGNNNDNYKRKKEFKSNNHFVNNMTPRMDSYGNFIYGKGGKPFNQIHYSFYNYNNYQINTTAPTSFNACGKSFNTFIPNQMHMNSFYNNQYGEKIDMDIKKSFSNNECTNNEFIISTLNQSKDQKIVNNFNNTNSNNISNSNNNEFDFHVSHFIKR